MRADTEGEVRRPRFQAGPRVGDCVVVLESISSTFEQFAMTLRRRGVEVVWVRPEGRAVSGIFRHLALGETRTTTPEHGLVEVLLEIGPERIADVVADESHAATVLAAARQAGVSAELLAVLERRHQWTDKWWAMTQLQEAGIPVPQALPGGTTTEDVIARLGLPVVVKPTLGSGGTGVRVVRSREELLEIPSGPGVYFERYLAGDNIQFSAVFDAGGQVLESILCRGVRLAGNQHGPVDAIEVIEAPRAEELGAAVLGLVNSRGLANIEFVEQDGEYWVHDVNLRPWGNLMASRTAGVDFLEEYVAVMSGGPRAGAAPRARPGQVVPVWPTAALSQARQDLPRALAGLTRDARPLLADVGPRYLTTSVLGFGIFAARRRLSEGRASRLVP